jgi:uncharacterized protein (UPF0305 family)
MAIDWMTERYEDLKSEKLQEEQEKQSDMDEVDQRILEREKQKQRDKKLENLAMNFCPYDYGQYIVEFIKENPKQVKEFLEQSGL